jgi:hypothetical protein
MDMLMQHSSFIAIVIRIDVKWVVGNRKWGIMIAVELRSQELGSSGDRQWGRARVDGCWYVVRQM